MAILRISDGVTTLNLLNSANYKAAADGMNISPPRSRQAWGARSLFRNGSDIIASQYENRIINLSFHILGSSLVDFQTRVRAIHRLLNDAKQRQILGHGAVVYFEFQLGSVVGASTFFDILSGELVLPNTFLSTNLYKNYTAIRAELNLTCRPIGRYTNQDIAQETLENSQSIYAIQDNFLVDDDGDHEIFAADWEAQTFTTAAAYTAVAAAIKCYREGVLGNVTFELFGTAVGLPSGVAIATGTIDLSTLYTNETWVICPFDSGVALANGVLYALVVHKAAGDLTNNIHWRVDGTAGMPAVGQRCWTATGAAPWNADATDDFLFAILSAETNYNYQDVTTAEAYGDIPAKLYARIDQTGAAGDKKVWVAKRSGSRQTDDLWLEGEDETSSTDLGAAGHVVYFSDEPLIAGSGGFYLRAYVDRNSPTNTLVLISRHNYDIATLPKGTFRVLIRCRFIPDGGQDYEGAYWALGWEYGDRSKTPDITISSDFVTNSADNTWDVLDLGLLTIPPLEDSEIASDSTFQLRIFQAVHWAVDAGDTYFDLDYIFLLPIDEGVVIVDDVPHDEKLALDNISNPNTVYILDAANLIIDTPDFVGRPFTLGRENTRIYVLRDDVDAVTFDSDITYQPQFLVV